MSEPNEIIPSNWHDFVKHVSQLIRSHAKRLEEISIRLATYMERSDTNRRSIEKMEALVTDVAKLRSDVDSLNRHVEQIDRGGPRIGSRDGEKQGKTDTATPAVVVEEKNGNGKSIWFALFTPNVLVFILVAVLVLALLATILLLVLGWPEHLVNGKGP